VAIGDSIITSGFSAIFPENIPVGVISKIQTPAGNSFYEIEVSLSANMESLQFTYVINNLLYDEQKQLEELNGK
jgi:rod shape-determining protein MreC